MKANPDKYQRKICNETVTNSKYKKLLEFKIHHELNFSEHVSPFCNKAGEKLNALSRIIASYMTFDQRRLIFSSFITSHSMDVS